MSAQGDPSNRGGYGYASAGPSSQGGAGAGSGGGGGGSGRGVPEEKQRVSRNFAYPLRPGLQSRVSGPPVRERVAQVEGSSSGRRPAPPPPGPASHGSSDRSGLPTGPKPKYVSRPGMSDDETNAQPSVAYRSTQQPIRPQPRSAEQDDSTSVDTHPSMQSDRSIYIGYDPTSDQSERDTNRDSDTLGAIPNFPVPASNQQRPPSSRRPIASSLYAEKAMGVSPIPEESPNLSRHDSYASSAAIPSSWADEENSSSNPENNRPLQRDENEGGLVRQASWGKRRKPTLTEIKSPERSRSTSSRSGGASSSDSGKTSAAIGAQSSGSAPRPSSKQSTPSPLSQPPIAAETYFSEKPAFYRTDSDISARNKELGLDKDIGIASGEPAFPPQASTRRASRSEGRAPGKRIPPRLNMDAVRDAEARGSLTSLPDLIRRATKLAAALETGRPGSSIAWGGRGSFFGFNTSSSESRTRDTDSISDILASFPPPALGHDGGRGTGAVPPSRMSEWPAPQDYSDGSADNGSVRQVKPTRRLCGLPLWAFIVLVILALVVITAAVVVPLQLVNLSKSSDDNDNSSAVAACKKSNPCQNGGENIATSNFCGCICTNGFTGSQCQTKEADASCTSFNFEDRGKTDGIKNATIGSALPRLFNISESAYNIELEPSLILGVFSLANLSCTLQNALVNFNGETEPETQLTKRGIVRMRQFASTTSTFSAATPTATTTAAQSSSTATRELALDQDALDFARVGVLFLVQNDGVGVAETAHEDLDAKFKAGIDFGNVTTGNATFQLDDRSIVLSDGEVIGGV